MEKINKILIKYLIFAMPLHVILLVLSVLSGGNAKGVLKVFTDVLSWNIIAWMGVLVIILMELLFYPELQRQFFESAAKLAGIKERDERESMAIDRAGRSAYISTLCLLVVMLLFYSINISFGKLPPEKWVDGKHKYLSIGFGLNLTDDRPKPADTDKYKEFSSWDLPLSKWSLIFLVIAWHSLSFMYYLRRANKYEKL